MLRPTPRTRRFPAPSCLHTLSLPICSQCMAVTRQRSGSGLQSGWHCSNPAVPLRHPSLEIARSQAWTDQFLPNISYLPILHEDTLWFWYRKPTFPGVLTPFLDKHPQVPPGMAIRCRDCAIS